MTLLEFRPEQLFAFLFVLCRCSGIFVFTPFFSSVNIPIQVRTILTILISYLFFLNYQFPMPAVPWTMTYMLSGLFLELLIGMAIGFAAQTLFAGLQFAGHIIGFQMGLSLVNTIDPLTSSRTSELSVYQNQMGVMLFLGMNAHHWFILAIANSLTALPPFSVTVNEQLLAKLTDMTAQVFVIGFQIAAPVTAVLLLTDIALGIIGRTAPQIHILVIGFPLKILAGVSALGLALYFFPAAMRAYSARLERDLGTILRLLGN